MIGLVDPDTDLFVPRVADKPAAQQFKELGPVLVRAGGEMQGHDAAAVRDPVQQIPAQHLLDSLLVRSMFAELGPLEVRIRGSDPRSGRVVQDDGIELLEVLRQKHRQVRADDRLVRAALSRLAPASRSCRRAHSIPCADPSDRGGPVC
jgi:aspartate carbamoyltransferase catalytic subunit